jgi:hypothetical protein
MRRAVAVLALVGACVAALLLAPVAAQEQEGAAAPPRQEAAAPVPPVPAGADAGPVAAALEAALEARDAAAALALFAPDAQVKEHVAVLAAGPERVAAWVEGCLLTDVRLVPGTRRFGPGAAATWEVRDALGCYWRARPDALRPAWDVAPAEGTLTVAVAGGAIATLTLDYDPAWQRRLLAAQAAPIRTAQAQATARAAQAAAAAPAGGEAWWERPRDRWYAEPPAQGARPSAAAPPTPAPAAPDTQDRRTPSLGPWLAALGAVLGGVGLLALLPRPREAL